MYPNMSDICTEFEQKLMKHVQDTTFSKKQKQDGCQWTYAIHTETHTH